MLQMQGQEHSPFGMPQGHTQELRQAPDTGPQGMDSAILSPECVISRLSKLLDASHPLCIYGGCDSSRSGSVPIRRALSDASVVHAARKRPRGEGMIGLPADPAQQAPGHDGSGQLAAADGQVQQSWQQERPPASAPVFSEFAPPAASMQGSGADMAGGDAAGADERQKHAKALAYLESMLGVAQQQSQVTLQPPPPL